MLGQNHYQSDIASTHRYLAQGADRPALVLTHCQNSVITALKSLLGMLGSDRFGAMIKSGDSRQSSSTFVRVQCADTLYSSNLSWFSGFDLIKYAMRR